MKWGVYSFDPYFTHVNLLADFALEHVTRHSEDLPLLRVLVPHHDNEVHSHITHVGYQFDGVLH